MVITVLPPPRAGGVPQPRASQGDGIQCNIPAPGAGTPRWRMQQRAEVLKVFLWA